MSMTAIIVSELKSGVIRDAVEQFRWWLSILNHLDCSSLWSMACGRHLASFGFVFLQTVFARRRFREMGFSLDDTDLARILLCCLFSLVAVIFFFTFRWYWLVVSFLLFVVASLLQGNSWNWFVWFGCIDASFKFEYLVGTYRFFTDKCRGLDGVELSWYADSLNNRARQKSSSSCFCSSCTLWIFD